MEGVTPTLTLWQLGRTPAACNPEQDDACRDWRDALLLLATFYLVIYYLFSLAPRKPKPCRVEYSWMHVLLVTFDTPASNNLMTSYIIGSLKWLQVWHMSWAWRFIIMVGLYLTYECKTSKIGKLLWMEVKFLVDNVLRSLCAWLSLFGSTSKIYSLWPDRHYITGRSKMLSEVTSLI